MGLSRHLLLRHSASISSSSPFAILLLFAATSSSFSTLWSSSSSPIAHSFVIRPSSVHPPGYRTAARATPFASTSSSSSPLTTRGDAGGEEDTAVEYRSWTTDNNTNNNNNNNNSDGPASASIIVMSSSSAAREEDREEGVDRPPPSPPVLPPPTLNRLVEYASSYAASYGLQVEIRGSSGNYVSAPVSLLPQSYPGYAFDVATSLSAPFGKLVDAVSRDGEFLKNSLSEARDIDEYTDKLLALYEEIYLGENGRGMEWGMHARNADRLGILRSDYMLHERNLDECDDDANDGGGGQGRRYSLKQVELNTIASSFAGLASRVANLHSFLTRRMEDDEGLVDFLRENERAVGSGEGGKDEGRGRGGVPESPAMTRLPMAMAVAYDRYVARFLPPSVNRGCGDDYTTTTTTTTTTTPRPIVLFVVQPGETNTVDQRMLEFALWENHGIPARRISLADAHDLVTLDESTGRLALIEREDDDIDGTTTTGSEVAIVYYRAGYAPTDYPSGMDGTEWLARERLERGRATKCPNLGYHLSGTKKVQQELARPGAVERFFPDDDGGTSTARLLRSAFAGLYGLGADANVDDLRAVGDVLFRGMEGRYVLKPQREGGGYNFYGKDMASKLMENCVVPSPSSEDDGSVVLGPALSEFILMERLFPPQQRAVRQGHHVVILHPHGIRRAL